MEGPMFTPEQIVQLLAARERSTPDPVKQHLEGIAVSIDAIRDVLIDQAGCLGEMRKRLEELERDVRELELRTRPHPGRC